MILLDKAKYESLIEPVSKLKINHLFALSVLKQHCFGEVYVDNEDNPSTYYIKHQYGMSLLFGNPKNENFNQALVAYIKNKNNERKNEEFLQADPDEWNVILPMLIKNNNLEGEVEELTRVNFTFNKEVYAALRESIELPVKNMGRTRSDLFGKIYGSVVPQYFYTDDNTFYTRSLGYTMVRRGELVSTAFAAYFHGNQLELGIETSEKYRGKGYAIYTCAALIDYCIRNSIEPVWACREDNKASMKLAQKLGFTPLLTLPYYHLL